jgi:hypothetical protein
MVKLILIIAAFGILSAEEPLTTTSPSEKGIYFQTDFLWWKADNLGFTYGFNQISNSRTFPNIGKMIQLDSDWAPGFQVGLGWNTGYQGWDLFAGWTWYENNTQESHHTDIPASSIGQGFYPSWPVAKTLGGGTDLGPYQDIEGKWSLRLNIADLFLSQPVINTQGLTLNLQWGVRGVSLFQKFACSFFNPIVEEIDTSIPAFGFNGKNDYLGLGPITGLESRWKLGKNFSLKGKVSSSLFYGRTQAKNTSKELEAPIIHHQFDLSFNQLIPFLQMAFGFQWGSYFRSDKFRFQIDCSWETNLWWNQFNVPVSYEGFASPSPSVGNSPLTTEGLTLNLQLGF